MLECKGWFEGWNKILSEISEKLEEIFPQNGELMIIKCAYPGCSTLYRRYVKEEDICRSIGKEKSLLFEIVTKFRNRFLLEEEKRIKIFCPAKKGCMKHSALND